jgi:hypothetical protein
MIFSENRFPLFGIMLYSALGLLFVLFIFAEHGPLFFGNAALSIAFLCRYPWRCCVDDRSGLFRYCFGATAH